MSYHSQFGQYLFRFPQVEAKIRVEIYAPRKINPSQGLGSTIVQSEELAQVEKVEAAKENSQTVSTRLGGVVEEAAQADLLDPVSWNLHQTRRH